MNIISKVQILESESRLLEAMKNNDIKSLDDLLHDNLLFIIPTGETVTKEMDIENLRSGNLKIDTILSSDQKISLIDDCGIVSVNIYLEGSYYNQPIDGKFRYMRVWKLLNGRCKVIGGAGIQM